jgi:hypothetical protein
VGDYLLFSGLSGSTLSISFVGGPDPGLAAINGIEIVANAPVLVPEPSTYALLLGGLLVLVYGIRRRQANL